MTPFLVQFIGNIGKREVIDAMNRFEHCVSYPGRTVMSYRYSFYLAFICSFLYQIDVLPMQWLSLLLKFFYVIYDIKLLYQFDIINKCVSDVKRKDLFQKFTENNKFFN
jgi:hypothetical protein